MNTENIESIEKKICEAERSYEIITHAWLSAKEVKNRIESLLILARELKKLEN